MSALHPLDDTRERLELEKIQAEIQKANADREKVHLEINELKRWYRRPAIIQPWATIVIGLLTASIGIGNGWFSTKLESLQNKKVEVQREIDALNNGRSELSAKNKSLESELEDKKNDLEDIKKKWKEVASQAAQLSDQLAQEQASSGNYKSDLARLRATLSQVEARATQATLEPTSKSGAVNGDQITFLTEQPRGYFLVVDTVDDTQGESEVRLLKAKGLPVYGVFRKSVGGFRILLGPLAMNDDGRSLVNRMRDAGVRSNSFFRIFPTPP